MTTQRSTSSGSGPSTSNAREELKDDAGRLKDTAAHRAKDEAETRKGQAARAAGSVSAALDTAAAELEHDRDAPDWLSSATRQAADGIDRLASEMDGRSIDEMGQQIARFARSNPGAFLAASAAAGFAAARVLRAGAEHRDHDEGSGQYGGGRTATPDQSYDPSAPSFGRANHDQTDAYVRDTEGAAL